MTRFSVFLTQAGYTGVVAGVKGVLEVFFPVAQLNDAVNAVMATYPEATEEYSKPVAEAREKLTAYFKGGIADFSGIQVDFTGMQEFAVKVLEACRAIPYGETMTYGQLAEAIGDPQAARAVGGALNKNKAMIIIPCHRVIKSGGELGGYSGGLEWKMRLLKIEGILK